jgi:uncharacterized repeat protein (TIGR01451 family)
MADSQTELTLANRFSKALIGRVAAVGLFAALGTGGVTFMVGKDKIEVGLATEKDQKPVDGAAVAAGFVEQVQASFAEGQAQTPKPDPAAFKSNPSAVPKSEPAPPAISKSSTAFSDNLSKQPNSSSAPPDRFAALDRPGNPAPTQVDVPKQEVPGKNPETKPASADPFGKPPTNKPASLGFDPNPAKQAPAEKTGSETLKPFTAPELPNRMIPTPGTNAPNLQAPVPKQGNDFDSTAAEAAKVANNSADKIGNSPANGLLKPFNPPTNQQRATELENEKPPQSGGIGGPPLVNPDKTDLNNPARLPAAAPPPNLSAINPSANSNPSSNSIAMQDTLPPRPIARPVSAPISSGSPINQPVGDTLRPAVPSSAAASFEGIEARTANVPGERKLDGMQAPALTVEKLSPKEITVNEISDFVIVIRNVGRVVANDVFVHDQVPANTEFQGSNPPPQQSSNSDRKLLWQIGTLVPGQEKRIKYQLKPTTPGEIGSVAHVTFSTQASMRTLVTNPILEIVHRAKPVSMIGSDVIFDVMISNKGNGPAKDVLIQEDVPPQLQYQDGFRELEYEVGTLMPGQSKRIQLALKAAAVGRLRNVVVASAAGGQRVQHELEMEVVAPKLTVQVDGPTKRFMGRQVSHQLRIANQGTAPSTNVDLVAKLPAGLRFMQANNQGVYRQASHSVHWSMAELAANSDAAVELLTMPVASGSQDIKFEAVADLNQTAAIAHPLSIEHLVEIGFDLEDLVDPIEVGADTAYQIKISNQGTQLANNVQLQVEFPNGVLPTSVEGNLQNQIAGQRVQFAPLNNLKPGDQLTVIVRAKGQAAGDHRVVVTMQADGRHSAVTKEEITRVYSDR